MTAKKSVKKTVGKSVVMHPGKNGGMLKSGGDHKRTGRPLDRIRALAMQGAEEATPEIARLALSADREETRVSAFNALMKTAGPTVLDVKARLGETLRVLRRLLPPELFVQVMRELDPIWDSPTEPT